MNYRCPCCGYFTLKEKPTGSYEICKVCFWEDEGVENPYNTESCGANHVSCLHEARTNYLKYGACEKEMTKHVREPREDELQGMDIFPEEFWN